MLCLCPPAKQDDDGGGSCCCGDRGDLGYYRRGGSCRVAVVIGAGVDTGTVDAIVVPVRDILTLVEHVARAAETSCADDA